MGRRSLTRGFGSFAIIAALVAGCASAGPTISPASSGATGLTGPSPTPVDCGVFPQPVSPRVKVPADELTVGISNGTTLVITLVVNGAVVNTDAPGTGDELSASRLPPLPWEVEARTSSGRRLLTLAVRDGDLWREPCANNSWSARRDLSCGRLDLWSLVDAAGPPPGPGYPGDCNP